MAVATPPASLDVVSRLITGLLSIRPIAQFAKHQARAMMIRRADRIGVHWTQDSAMLQARGQSTWDRERLALTELSLTYPNYYLTSFHAYASGNLCWEAATEVESAARAVHANIWPELGAQGDTHLRQTYHQQLQAHLPQPPQKILDIGCGAGLSTFALQGCYPQAKVTGLDLSPYFLAIANHRSQLQQQPIQWLHRAGEQTQLPAQSFDLISICLVVHELPQTATRALLQEAHRLLRPHGHLAIMDMNPQSEFLKRLPPFILTLLKSTEPYLDEYFSLDLPQAIQQASFIEPSVTFNSPRHRTLIAQRP